MAPVVNQLWLKNTFDRLNILLHTVKKYTQKQFENHFILSSQKERVGRAIPFFLNSTDYDFCNLVIFQTTE